MADDDSLTLPRGDRPGFRRSTVRIEPGDGRPYVADEWRDCLVVIEAGEVELEATSGVTHTCRGGDILWLVGLPVRRITCRGSVPAVITTIRRD